MSELSPLILTLKLDQKTFAYFDRLRQQYFSPERNVLPAHITLFHKLPGDRETDVHQVLQHVCSCTSKLSLTFPTVRFLGQGVAVDVTCPELLQLRQQLATQWHTWLSPQDQQRYRPHITIQNKTTANEARHLYEQLSHDWQPLAGYGEGLLLWYYQGGPWELAGEFLFQLSNLN